MKQRRRRSQKAGLPPGTLVHIGERKAETVRLTLIQYCEGDYQEKDLKTVEDVLSALSVANPETITWLDIGGIHDLELIQQVGGFFQLHPLLLEDVVNTEQRPKEDDYGDYLYVVAKMLYCGSVPQTIKVEQISLVLGRNFVLSFQENGGDVFSAIRERLRTGKGRTRKLGADYLLYSLLDAIVDNYFTVLEVLGEKIEQEEDKVLADPDAKTLSNMYALRRDLLFVRRAVWPLREVVNSLARGESRFIADSTKTYLKDVYDHTVQIIDTVEISREMIAGMLDIYLSNVSNRMTAVMKVLTIIATIFMPLTFIAGVYGMNFEHMPELRWQWGYPIILLVMAVIGISMIRIFRKKRWL